MVLDNYNSMSMQEYIKLTLGDKADLLWKNGLFIDTYSDKVITANLYFINNFFVEVIVTHNNSQIREITPFKTGSRLEKYLDMISLKELI
jgi:hypothetical protein